MNDSRLRIPNALRYPNFTRFPVRASLAVLAIQMQTVAVGWQVYEISRDPLDLGLIGLSQFLPFVLLVLPAGHVADRFHRQRILSLCYATEVICAVLFLAFTLSGMAKVWPVFAVMTLFGVARAFSAPASQAVIPNLVPISGFGNAMALEFIDVSGRDHCRSDIWRTFIPRRPQVVYAAVAILLSVAVILMSMVKRLDAKRSTEPASWHTVLEGLRFVRSRPVVLGAISLDLFAVLFGGATAACLCPRRTPRGANRLRSAANRPGVGAALMAVMLAFSPMSRNVGRWMFAGVVLFGVSTVVFGLSKIFLVSSSRCFCLALAT